MENIFEKTHEEKFKLHQLKAEWQNDMKRKHGINYKSWYKKNYTVNFKLGS